MRQIICAKVNPRLLTKADRLFTGTVEGRIIELLQNARRAGASEVKIVNKDKLITVQDNGSGIEDFQKLLDLGGSGWDEKFERGEDPAGVGLFSLAPRETTIISKNKKIVISKDGWAGKPVNLTESKEFVSGTKFIFEDEKPWDIDLVEKHAVFCGMKIIVDGKLCHSMPFCRGQAECYEMPGCKIEVTKDISKYHVGWTATWYYGRVLVNFHGQVVQMNYWPGQNHSGLTILVDIANDTDIRLMLPARTRLVENKAFEKLKQAVELEYYKYYQQQKTHHLPYSEFLRARELGIELPEAEPQFYTGLVFDEYEQAVEVVKPEGFGLKDCYLCFNDECKDNRAETNAHLLGALGRFKHKPFVPVTINKSHMGYSWTKLPKVTKVIVKTGEELLRQNIFAGEIACFDKLLITVHTSDGNEYSSDVCMAVIRAPKRNKYQWYDEVVCVTKEARDNLSLDNIWYHLGGFDVEGDSYDTQEYAFEKELNEFWNELVGPYESLRQEICSLVNSRHDLYGKWRRISLTGEGVLEIVFKGGKTEIAKPPK